jgi:hypothetical protein
LTFIGNHQHAHWLQHLWPWIAGHNQKLFTKKNGSLSHQYFPIVFLEMLKVSISLAPCFPAASPRG